MFYADAGNFERDVRQILQVGQYLYCTMLLQSFCYHGWSS